MPKLTDRTVLLFYRDFEVDKWFPGDRYLKRMIRPAYNLFNRRKKVSGFLTNFRLLVKALRQQGYEVHVNNRSLARRNPEHPVGLTGYPAVLDGWNLSNPAVLGRGLYDHPSQAPGLMDDPRNRFYLVGSEWVRELFAPYYGSKCVIWFAGLDLEKWYDTRNDPKTIDVLLYDKIHWERERYRRKLVEPIMERLQRRGLTVEVLQYGLYDYPAYRAALSASRSMIFLGEHETQGFAYQEALASNVPVLAWDQGWWLDPTRLKFENRPIRATSVPYFSEECGDRFRNLDEFDEALDRFWSRIGDFEPRAYVERELSLKKSAEVYMSYYNAAKQPPTASAG